MRVQFIKVLPAVIALASVLAVASCAKPDEEPASATAVSDVTAGDATDEFSAEAMSSSTSSSASLLPGLTPVTTTTSSSTAAS